jgi:quercetin dioxygenase-like cupin family protein
VAPFPQSTQITNPHEHIKDRTMSTDEISVGQLGIRYLIDGSQTASLGMFELTVPPASNVPPPHSHSNNEEIVYVLEGTLRYTVGSETRDLTPGQSMQTPRGTGHAFSNPHGSVARALIVLSPDIGAQYFKDVAAVVNAGGPPDKGALVAVMSRYGLVPSAPK